MQPAAYATVFRRGGNMSGIHRHGPQVRNVLGSHESRALQVVALRAGRQLFTRLGRQR